MHHRWKYRRGRNSLICLITHAIYNVHCISVPLLRRTHVGCRIWCARAVRDSVYWTMTCTTVTHLNVTLSNDIFFVFLWPLLLLRRHSSDLHQTYTVHQPTNSTNYIYGTLDPFNNSPGWGGVVAHKVEDHVRTFIQVVCTRIIVDGATMDVPLDRNEHWCSTVQPELSTGCLIAAESVEKNHWRLYDESTYVIDFTCIFWHKSFVFHNIFNFI